MNERMKQQSWDVPVPMIRCGDLLLTRAEGAARLSRVMHAAQAATESVTESAQPLPGKQAGLLAFLMRHHRQIVSKSRLIEAVWGSDGVAPGVLDVHMTRLRRTLQHIDSTGESVRIETRRGMGYALHVEGGPE